MDTTFFGEELILPTIAIIGRPNVGKSTLVNRLCQSNDAIVFDKPGVTRDRTYQNASWGGKEFQIIDTGLVFDDDSEFLPEIRTQVFLALEELPRYLSLMGIKALLMVIYQLQNG